MDPSMIMAGLNVLKGMGSKGQDQGQDQGQGQKRGLGVNMSPGQSGGGLISKLSSIANSFSPLAGG